MKNLGLGLGVAAVAVPIVGWSLTGFANPYLLLVGENVEPENAALLINQYGRQENRGIENAELVRSGRVTYNSRTHSLVKFPVTQVTWTLTDDPDVQTETPQAVNFSLGPVPISEDVTVGLFIPTGNDGENFQNFITTYSRDVGNFVQGPLRQGIGQCANRTAVELELDNPLEYIESRATEFRDELMRCVQDRFTEIELVTLDLLGSPDWKDDRIREQLISLQESKAQADKAEEQRKAAEAEAQTQLAKVEGEVQAEKLRASLLEDPLYRQQLEFDLRKQQLEIERLRAEKWDGQEPAPTYIQTPVTQVAPAANQE